MTKTYDLYVDAVLEGNYKSCNEAINSAYKYMNVSIPCLIIKSKWGLKDNDKNTW